MRVTATFFGEALQLLVRIHGNRPCVDQHQMIAIIRGLGEAEDAYLQAPTMREYRLTTCYERRICLTCESSLQDGSRHCGPCLESRIRGKR